MKHFITLLIISLLSISSSVVAQNVYVNKNYNVFYGAYTYHTDSNCTKIKKSSVSVPMEMAIKNGCTPCELCKTSTTPQHPVVMVNNTLNAGDYLLKSSILDYSALTTAAITTAVALSMDTKKDQVTAGIIGGSVTLILGITSISYKYKAGKELKLSTNKIQYTF